MKALQKNAPFGENTYGLQKSYKVHKHRIKNMRKCIDNETPRSFVGQSGPRSPNRRVIAKQMAEENLRKENFLLARRIFKIMQGESAITQSINHNDHIENHPGTMNFRRRLEEAQQIHHKNLMFAIRMQAVQPTYRHTDLSVVRVSRQRADSPGNKSSRRKNKFMKEFEYSLRMAEEQDDSVEDGGIGVYQGFMVDENSQSTLPGKTNQHGYHNKRPRTILLQYTKAQDNRILDVVVLKEPFRDRYAIFGLDVDDGQRFELRLSSEDVSNILDGDILVTSVDNVEVWMALLNKVKLKPVANFNHLPFTNQEIDVLSANGLAFDFPNTYGQSVTDGSTMDNISIRSMKSTPNQEMGYVDETNDRPQSRAVASRSNTADSYGIPNPDEFENFPIFDYGPNNEDDVPLSSRTEASGSPPRAASGGGRPITSSRHSRGKGQPHEQRNKNTLEDVLLENDLETAEMIRASNAAAALATENQKAAAKKDAPSLSPKQPTSRPSSKPASARVTNARTTATNAPPSTTTPPAATTNAAPLKPVPPSKPKTPTNNTNAKTTQVKNEPSTSAPTTNAPVRPSSRPSSTKQTPASESSTTAANGAAKPSSGNNKTNNAVSTSQQLPQEAVPTPVPQQQPNTSATPAAASVSAVVPTSSKNKEPSQASTPATKAELVEIAHVVADEAVLQAVTSITDIHSPEKSKNNAPHKAIAPVAASVPAATTAPVATVSVTTTPSASATPAVKNNVPAAAPASVVSSAVPATTAATTVSTSAATPTTAAAKTTPATATAPAATTSVAPFAASPVTSDPTTATKTAPVSAAAPATASPATVAKKEPAPVSAPVTTVSATAAASTAAKTTPVPATAATTSVAPTAAAPVTAAGTSTAKTPAAATVPAKSAAAPAAVTSATTSATTATPAATAIAAPATAAAKAASVTAPVTSVPTTAAAAPATAAPATTSVVPTATAPVIATSTAASTTATGATSAAAKTPAVVTTAAPTPVITATSTALPANGSIASSTMQSPDPLEDSVEYEMSYETLDQSTISSPQKQQQLEKKTKPLDQDIPEEDIPDETI